MSNNQSLQAINCLTGKQVTVDAVTGQWKATVNGGTPPKDLPFVGPGLVDLQVNGVNGVDFNGVSLDAQGLEDAARYLLSQGVTTFFPTIITNSTNQTLKLLSTIDKACRKNVLLGQCIGGIHLEGPFISKVDGARGAHNKRFVKPPDWELFEKFQKAAGGRIKLITLSPEWDSAAEFIRRCTKNGVLVSVGHSMASPDQLSVAAEAGATLSTHIGNAVPLVLPRHPNILWEQLASDALWPSLIADGFHVPDSFMKVVMAAKGDKYFLVSDCTYFSGLKPGVYKTHIGREVLLEENGRLSMAGGKGLLAGATKTLLKGVEYLVDRKLATIGHAWQMASVVPGSIIGRSVGVPENSPDLVVFRIQNKAIIVSRVYKSGVLVYER